MASTILCLRATTKGQVVAVQKLTIEVCGDESISYSRSSPFERYFTFDRSEVSQMKTIDLTTLGFLFSSSRVNCPVSYKFIQEENGTNSDFNGP